MWRSAGRYREFTLRLLFITSLLAIDVFGELVQGSLEDLLNLADLSLALLLVVELFVVSSNHIDQLFDIATRHNDIANLLLGLHLLPHHELVGPVRADHT